MQLLEYVFALLVVVAMLAAFCWLVWVSLHGLWGIFKGAQHLRRGEADPMLGTKDKGEWLFYVSGWLAGMALLWYFLSRYF